MKPSLHPSGICELLLASMILISAAAQATTYSSTGSGNWNNPSIWSGGVIPSVGDIVNIQAGHTITIPSGYAAQCASLTMNSNNAASSSNLTFSDASSSLHVTGNLVCNAVTTSTDIASVISLSGGSLTVDGYIQLGNNTIGTGAYYYQLQPQDGTVTVGGNISFVITAGSGHSGSIDLTGTSTLGVAGLIQGNGYLNGSNTSTVLFQGTAAQSVSLNSSYYTYGNIILKNSNASGVTLAGNLTTGNVLGNITVQSGLFSNGGYAITGTSGQTFTVSNGATFKLTGTSAIPAGYTVSLGSTSTEQFAGSAQNIDPETYGILSISGSGTKTTTGGIVTTGDVTIAQNLTLGGDMIVGGKLTLTSGTIAEGGYTIKVQGDVTGNTCSISGGTFECNGSSLQIIGAGNTNFNNFAVNNPGGVNFYGTINGTLNIITGNFNVTGTCYLNGPITGNANNVKTTLSSSIWFGASTSVQMPSSITTINALIINGPGTVSLNSDISVFIMGLHGGIFSAGNHTIHMLSGGDCGLGYGGTFDYGTSQILFDDGGMFSGSGPIQTFDVVLAGGLVSFTSNVSIVHSLILSGNGGRPLNFAPTYLHGSTLIYRSGGSWNRILEWSATSGRGCPSNVLVTNGTSLSVAGSTAILATGNLQIDPGSQFNMTGSNANVTISGNIDVYGALNFQYYLTIGGNFTLHPGSSYYQFGGTVTFNGSSRQTIAGPSTGYTLAFSVLALTGAGGVELSSSPSTNISVGQSVTSGADALQLGSFFDLKGNTATLSSTVPSNIKVTGGVCTMLNSGGGGGGGGIVITGGQKTVTSSGGGTLLLDHTCSMCLHTGLDCGSGLTTVDGTLEIDAGGSIVTNPPEYDPFSILQYSTGGAYTAGTEWAANSTSGAGVPYEVRLGIFGSSLSFGTATQYRAVTGNLTVPTGTTLSLSSVPDGDLKVGGDVMLSGTFNTNGRTLWLTGSGTQTISGGGGGTLSLSCLNLAKPSGLVQTISDLIITPSGSGYALVNGGGGGGGGGRLDLNGKNLTIHGGGIDPNITLFGSATTNISLDGTVSPTYISIDASAQPAQQQSNNVTLNANGGLTLGSDFTVNGTLTIQGSTLNTGSHWVILGENGSLDETAGTVIQGNVKTERTLNQTAGTVTFGSMGLDVTLHGAALGKTDIYRHTGSSLTGNGKSSILRNFKIVPTTNAGLYADLVFHYVHAELNGEEEGSLTLFKSTDDGTNWSNWSGTQDADQNTISTYGLYDLSTWTAADNAHIMGNTPVPTTTSIQPSSKLVGQSGFSLTVNGTNFLSGVSMVRIDGSERATQYINETQLTADILTGDLSTSAGKNITVYSSGGGGESNAQVLAVNKISATLHLANLTQVYNGGPLPITVTTDPEGLSGVSVTYNGSSAAPIDVGYYHVIATLMNDHYEAPPVDSTLEIQATIIASAGLHGSISPPDARIVDPDSSMAYTFLPDEGFCADSLYIDGIYTGPAPDGYAFTHVHNNHTIHVTFALKVHTITASAGPNGSISPVGAVSVDHAADKTFSITPDLDFRIDSVFINGVYRGTMGGYTFHGVRGDSTIRAVFGRIVVDVSVHASPRWNMLSMPVEYAHATVGSMYTHASHPAYCYENHAYAAKETLQFGCSYWMRFGDGHDYVINGIRHTVFTIDVQSGWNMIGALSDTALASDITGDPGDMTISRFFGYNNRYMPTDTLLPGKGYWVKASKDGYLTLRCPTALLKAAVKGITLIAVSAEQPPPPPMDGSEQDVSRVPTEYKLEQAFPNPFNPTTTIRYQLPADSKVTIRIYSIMGQEVAELVDGVQAAGYRQMVWNASALASGMYFYRIEAITVDDPGRVFVASKKLMLVK